MSSAECRRCIMKTHMIRVDHGMALEGGKISASMPDGSKFPCFDCFYVGHVTTNYTLFKDGGTD